MGVGSSRKTPHRERGQPNQGLKEELDNILDRERTLFQDHKSTQQGGEGGEGGILQSPNDSIILSCTQQVSNKGVPEVEFSGLRAHLFIAQHRPFERSSFGPVAAAVAPRGPRPGTIFETHLIMNRCKGLPGPSL